MSNPDILIDPDTGMEYDRGSFGYERLRIMAEAERIAAQLGPVGPWYMERLRAMEAELQAKVRGLQEEALTRYFGDDWGPAS